MYFALSHREPGVDPGRGHAPKLKFAGPNLLSSPAPQQTCKKKIYVVHSYQIINIWNKDTLL